jgi:hypothetical protein
MPEGNHFLARCKISHGALPQVVSASFRGRQDLSCHIFFKSCVTKGSHGVGVGSHTALAAPVRAKLVDGPLAACQLKRVKPRFHDVFLPARIGTDSSGRALPNLGELAAEIRSGRRRLRLRAARSAADLPGFPLLPSVERNRPPWRLMLQASAEGAVNQASGPARATMSARTSPACRDTVRARIIPQKRRVARARCRCGLLSQMTDSVFSGEFIE